MQNYFEFLNSVKICAGENSIENAPYELDFLGCRKPLILSGNFIAKAGLLKLVTDILEKSNIDCGTVFTDIPNDSSVEIIHTIANIYKQNRCDGIVAIGGGSVIDTAKGTRMVLSQSVKDILELSGNEIIKKGKHIPFVVLPTTCGTGSECTGVAVIKNHKTGVKMEFISGELLPDTALIDERLTATLPPKLIASGAMDALCHSIEAFSGAQKNPLSDAYATTAIKLIVNNLPKALSHSTAQTRADLSLASTLAGIAFSNSMVGLVHAIGHACGGEAGVPHGNAMAVLLPECMKFNLNACQDTYGELLLYLTDSASFAATPKQDRAQAAVDFVKGFEKKINKLCGIGLKLSDYGVKEENLSTIAQKALNDGAVITNKKSVNLKDIKQILKNCL